MRRAELAADFRPIVVAVAVWQPVECQKLSDAAAPDDEKGGDASHSLGRSGWGLGCACHTQRAVLSSSPGTPGSVASFAGARACGRIPARPDREHRASGDEWQICSPRLLKCLLSALE